MQTSVPDMSDLARLTFPLSQAAFTDERDNFRRKGGIDAMAVPENLEVEKGELVKSRDEAMTQAKVESPATDPTSRDHAPPL